VNTSNANPTVSSIDSAASPFEALAALGALDVSPQCLEVCVNQSVHHPMFQADADEWHASVDGVNLRLNCIPVQGAETVYHRIHLTATNTTTQPLEVNLKWVLPLMDQQEVSRWMVPALIYKLAEQQYPGIHPSLVGDNLSLLQGPTWTLRADLCALPMAMAWTPSGSVALVMEEVLHGHMTSIGLDNREGQQALIGSWPYREEPRRREINQHASDREQPMISFVTLEPAQSVTLHCDIYVGDADPHAYAAILRENFHQLDPIHPTHPRAPMSALADAAAFGLMAWHYDESHRALWETVAWEEHNGLEPGSYVQRYEMHSAFVSGIPHAYAMLDQGLHAGDQSLIEAGRHVIDHCCESLTPCGLFWSLYDREKGWSTGWPSPQRKMAQPHLDREIGDLQARTIAEAALFTAIALQRDPDAPGRSTWLAALRSNLDFILSIQTPDGNPGQAYMPGGDVLDWDGEEGVLWIAALAEGYRVLGDTKYRDAAERAGAYYLPAVRDAYLTGAPEAMHLLPTSEDPQNAVIGYIRLYEITQDPQWIEAAKLSAEWFMTFRWQYNTQFPKDTLLHTYGFATKGMDISSPNNSHLHPFGQIAIPELIRLWELTGDTYFLKQTRNNLHACSQTMCWEDGVYNGRRGMSTERFVQSDFDMPKGTMMQLGHSWTTGLVLYASRWVADQASVCIDQAAGVAVALEAVEVSGGPGAWVVDNPWDVPIPLKVRCGWGGSGS